ncbi:hypothetical protein SNE40_014002 [Patella caerulea]|uniref:Uncharacterized protein n=2 Tax=Patella caerulea TaxID=87958 RepID=A0AAN8JDP6_PATCE
MIFIMRPQSRPLTKCTILLFCLMTGTFARTLEELIIELKDKTESLQVKKQTQFIPLLSWQKDKGVYGSEVKLNFHGSSHLAFVRDEFSVFDNNMFVTAWVTSCLLEAYRYGGGPKPSRSHIELSLNSINQYRNKNRKYENSIMSFWPQVYNKTTSTYISTPANLLKLFDETDGLPVKTIEDILKLFGFNDIGKLIERLLGEKPMFRSAFHIPPDFDDTFVNIGLGALLTDVKADFDTEQQSWMNSNTNLTSVFDALKKYAYRPFSNDSNINTIDPRSYYYLSTFLEEVLSDATDLALTPTWISNIDETSNMRSKGVSMPFNINNVDVTVSSNVIYGITSSILTGLVPVSTLDDSDIQQIYLNTTNMVAYQLRTDFHQRRDLALTYYPSVFELYWFVARTVFLLNEKSKYSKLPHQDLETVLATLEPVLETHVTSKILTQAKPEGSNMLYFDDFLGDRDYDDNNHTLVKGDDRIFTTAMAVNTLISTWSIFDDKSSKLFWKKDVTLNVKDVISKCVNWLVKYTLSDDFKPWNCFFSGSGKGIDSMPFFFPINRLEFLNGTKITDYNHFPHGAPYIIGFKGVVPKSSYDNMVQNETHFGRKTTTTFSGYNSGSGYFPFWSSEPYTYATSMLALSQFNNIVKDDIKTNLIG